MSIDAMKQALDAFGEIAWSNNSQWQSDRAKAAITTLRERLAQPEQEYVIDCPRCGHCCPQRKPLTDEEIEVLWQNTSPYYDQQDFARAIEAAHGITGEQT